MAKKQSKKRATKKSVVRFDPTRQYRPSKSSSVEDRDACAIYAVVLKDGVPSHDLIEKSIVALQKMLHRAGNVDGEGDGCGLLVDIPRKIWEGEIVQGGHESELAYDAAFVVGHIFIPRALKGRIRELKHDALQLVNRSGMRVLAEREGAVDSSALGPSAREEEPIFWQIAGLASTKDPSERDAQLFELAVELEGELGVNVASFSGGSCVYKVMGVPEVLPNYFDDLRDPRGETAILLGHNRYSTNTLPTFMRVQPFSMLGHNGEINTIEHLRHEARMLDIPIQEGCSDSQYLNRTIEGLVHRQKLTLPEAIESVLPPIVDEVRELPEEMRDFYMYLRQSVGPVAQGPVALVSAYGDECVFSVDALGLRPLWQIETSDAYVFSSEPGVVSISDLVAEPQPLAPGQKVMVQLDREKGATLASHDEMQKIVMSRFLERSGAEKVGNYSRAFETGGPLEGPDIAGYSSAGPAEPLKVEDRVLAGFGWQREDVRLVQQMASNGDEPIGSLGYDGPLAVLSEERQNLADYFKETVAVVTNPAIDREREVEHFSCRTEYGARPTLHSAGMEPMAVEAQFPIILGGHHGPAPLSDKTLREVARDHNTYLLEDLWELFPGHRSRVLDISCTEAETTQGALERLRHEAVKAVKEGTQLLVLSDRTVAEGDRKYLDPHLTTSVIDIALKETWVGSEHENLRRHASIVLRSSAIRNLHDIVLALGLGADGVCPYTMVEVICLDEYKTDIENLCKAVRKGIEKVISTIGIHEVRGYARQFSCIGLKPELVELFATEGYFSSNKAGVGFAEMDSDAEERQRVLSEPEKAKTAKTFRFYPKVYKRAIAAANGSGSFAEYSEKVIEQEAEHPVALRHLLRLKSEPGRESIDKSEVDTGVGLHEYPLVISAMSFGSQGETAFRAYAEAAKQTNIICMNGEGGEIQDMYGKYGKWRGQQVASGRFGVTSDMLNSSYIAEIKIGQGAKPGEGGHLPAKKVTNKVAAARNATAGTDLISPSNNHDLYSIEDLAQLIDELKTANPDVRVSIKVPVVPNIGTIGVGIAKAGADIITLAGFDGGTGAARQHALRHVGLPSDIGTRAVHRALMEAGIRNRVEIWADGGMRHATDVIKLMCLGANRVSFGTLAMVSLGCTICRGCQLDTCHVGIATQIETKEEAEAKGLKKFTPREYKPAVENCVRFFTGMGEEVGELTAQLGFERTQELVGRSDLLEQFARLEEIDLAEMIRPLEEFLELEPVDLPVEEDVREEANLVLSRPIRMKPKEASTKIAGYAPEICSGNRISQEFGRPTDAYDRVLGTELAGALARARVFDSAPTSIEDTLATLVFNGGSVAGSGFGAFNVYGVDLRVVGGAQDGVGKCMFGGNISILKGKSSTGERVNGSVGKSFAYGAQRGCFIVQGNADTRFCIRLSGADVIIGGEPEQPLMDELGHIADRANIKGYGFEYMTAGRALVLGDPGPWICAGQTGGRVYLRINEEWNLGLDALQRRIGKGARVTIKQLDGEGILDILELMDRYASELRATKQEDEAERVLKLAVESEKHFMMVVPEEKQTDPSVSTE